MANFVQQPCDEGVIRSRDAVAPCARASRRWVLAATILGSSMVFVDGTVVNVALPAAGLLAIAIFGIVMLNVFNRSLDRQLAAQDVPAAAQRSLDEQRINLAAAKIADEIPPSLREVLGQAIDQSFVQGFRTVTLVGAALALASGISSLLLISGRAESRR